MLVGYPLSTHNITSTRREKFAKQGWMNGELINYFFQKIQKGVEIYI